MCGVCACIHAAFFWQCELQLQIIDKRSALTSSLFFINVPLQVRFVLWKIAHMHGIPWSAAIQEWQHGSAYIDLK